MDSVDTSLISFKAICTFTIELSEMFSKKHRPLKLYKRLIEHTKISHEKPIQKHINAFRTFCINNRDAIMNKDEKMITLNRISYSKSVYIDIIEIFKMADKQTTQVIWSHLLCISALLDPAGKAKEILKRNLKEGKIGGGENNFLTDIIDKVEAHIDPDANPMEAVSSIMKSGIFTDLIGGMNEGISNGSLDLGKLMGAVQGMVGQLGEQSSDPQTAGAMNMLNSMMGNIEASTSNNSQGTPDLAALMQGLMSGIPSNIPQESLNKNSIILEK